MTYKEFKAKYAQEDVDKVVEFLDDLADAIETDEPFATNTIRIVQETSSTVSSSLED